MSHYGVVLTASKAAMRSSSSVDQAHVSTAQGSNPYESLAELFHAAGPKTEKDKALVAAYWVQVCENQATFQSQSLNDQLKDLGHGIGNITEARRAQN